MLVEAVRCADLRQNNIDIYDNPDTLKCGDQSVFNMDYQLHGVNKGGILRCINEVVTWHKED